MTEYIAINDVIQNIQDLQFTMSMCSSVEQCEGMKRAQRIIAEYIRVAMKPADVKPVRHGKWKRGAFTDVAPKDIKFFYCSECGIRYQHIEFPGNYCPNCGAEMERYNG